MRILLLIGAGLFALLSGAPPSVAGEAMGEEWGTVEEWLVENQEYDPPPPGRGCSIILVHGFGGSPYDLKPLALALRDSGCRLVVPVVPGETKKYSNDERDGMEADEPIAWLGDLVAEETERSGRKPYVVGFSMGGTLATIEAVQGTVERLVLVAPYYSLAWGDEGLEEVSRILSHVIASVPKPWKGKVNSPEGYDRYRPGAYFVSLHAFLRLQELADRAREQVPNLPDMPMLVLVSPEDGVASYEVTVSLFQDRPQTEIMSFPESNHILFFDYDAEEAAAAVQKFLLGY